jgi:hypothetical protein
MKLENKEKIQFAVVFSIFLYLSLHRFFLLVVLSEHESLQDYQLFWGTVYQLMAWVGAFFGLFYSRRWGGFRSAVGKSILFFSFGLLLQSFGQSSYSYYIYSNIEILYPSIGDVGFFGSIPMYIAGIYFLGKAVGAKVSLAHFKNTILSVLIPVALFAISSYFFLRGHEYDWSSPVTVFLDFGYPIGQAIYVSMALLVYILSRKTLGGLMKQSSLLFVAALALQYISDFSFLYQNSRATFVAGGSVDYMYLASYFLMAFALVNFGLKFERIRKS